MGPSLIGWAKNDTSAAGLKEPVCGLFTAVQENGWLTIGVGHGPDVENQVILEVTDTAPYQLTTIAVTSAAPSPAEWTFTKVQGTLL